jgi:uncharacterized protein (TIGR02466 family)
MSNIVERFCFREIITKFTGDESVNQDSIKYIYKLLNDDTVRKNKLSIREGIQLRDMHTNKEWCDLFSNNISVIYEVASDWIRHSWSIDDLSDVALGINNMWINYSPPGAYNVLHHHPHANISGVFYLQSEENSGSIVFPHPFPHELSASRAHRVYPEENTGLLFYSGLQHYVDVNHSTSDRISVSFNIIVTDRSHRFG